MDHQVQITQTRPAADPRVSRIDFDCPELAAAAQPGQFLQVGLPDAAGCFLRRPLCVFDTDAQTGQVGLLVQEVGKGTAWLTGAPIGARLQVMGPLGHGWRLPETTAGERAQDPLDAGGAPQQRALLIGGGVGAAALLMLAKTLLAAGAAVDVVLGAATVGLLAAGPDFEAALAVADECSGQGVAVSASRPARLYYCTDDGSFGHHGFVTDVVAELLAEGGYDQMYCCGPTPMMKAVAAQAKEAKVACQVSLEERMACGIGACCGCPVDTVDGKKGVCKVGPVFDAEVLLW
jgi:dihydroorotate dehydrogenase electron transfer subunit